MRHMYDNDSFSLASRGREGEGGDSQCLQSVAAASRDALGNIRGWDGLLVDDLHSL